MSDFINIPLGYNIPSQIPLDAKQYVQNKEDLKDLGFGNSKVFSYYKGLLFYCIDDAERYEWTEVTSLNDGTGLLTVNYRYPINHSAFGINYSNKEYNFFKYDLSTIVDGSETKIVAGNNIVLTGDGTIDDPYSISINNIPSNTILENGFNTVIEGNGSSITPYKVNVTFPTPPNGSETKVIAGSNVTVSGNGTVALPYVISTNPQATPTILANGDNTTIVGTGTNINPYRVNVLLPTPQPLPDGSETKVVAGTNINITGTGTVASPYNISSIPEETIQKTITSNYTLTSNDHDSVIFINNSTFDLTITVPAGLISKFNCGFIQQGTGLVSFIASGVTIKTPTGLKIKGQNYNAYIEKVGSTEVFHLLGNVIT